MEYDLQASDAFRDMCSSAMDLCINAGLIAVALQDDRYPDEVKERFIERLRAYETFFQQEIESVQTFGESFD